MYYTFLAYLAAAAYVSAPILLITGWIRWARRAQPRAFFPLVALAGFSLGSISVLLAAGSMIYGWRIGGFPYYDPRLILIYALGSVLSLAGLALGLAGLARPSPLRWHAPALSLMMLLLWLFRAASE